jgi:hypothetical protein
MLTKLARVSMASRLQRSVLAMSLMLIDCGGEVSAHGAATEAGGWTSHPGVGSETQDSGPVSSSAPGSTAGSLGGGSTDATVTTNATDATAAMGRLSPVDASHPDVASDGHHDAPPDLVSPDAAARVCTPGQDSTCNDNPSISSLHGKCLPDGTCSCTIGPGLNPATGKCR